MKIGLISGEFPPMPGGVGDYTRRLAERIQAQGHDVHILSRAGSTSEGLKISAVRNWGPGCLPAIRDWTRRQAFDLVNLQYQTAAYDMSPFIHFLPRAIDAPLVATFHDLRYPYLFPKAGPLRNWIVRRLAQTSAGVIATNQEDDLRLSHLPTRRLIPIGSNIPRADDRERSARPSADSDAFVIGHFGFVSALKGVEHLIEAIAKLRAQGLDLRLLFIGGRSNAAGSRADLAFQSALDERIRQLELGGAVTWTGYLPDEAVASRLRAVDLMALPYADGASYRRGSLMAAIENGCAILTTEPAVEVETFAHGCNLWLVAPGSAEALERAIRHLMNDRRQLKRLRIGAAHLRSQFDWDAIARETIVFFRTLI